MNVVIRKIEERDYQQVKELFVDLVRKMAEYNPTRLKEPSPEYKEWYFQKMIALVKDGTGYIGVAEIDGKVVGCVNGYIKKQSKEDLLERKKMKVGYIEDLFVKSEYRGKGIGRKLLQSMENFFREMKCECIELSALTKNTDAFKLYEEAGYEVYLVEMLKKMKWS